MTITLRSHINDRVLAQLHGKGKFSWAQNESAHAVGFAFLDGEFLDAPALVRSLSKYHADDIPNLLPRLSGNFALIYFDENQLIAAVDGIRSFPLFYGRAGDQFVISDSADEVYAKVNSPNIPASCAAEFLCTSKVTGRETLFPEVNQLLAGELMKVRTDNPESLQLSRYFTYAHEQPTVTNENLLLEQLDQIHISVFSRLIDSLNGRKAVIPLSGGEDSRLIAWMMDRLGYDNVLYLTYGPKNNWEAQIAKEIADYFGKPWKFVSTTHKKWLYWFNHTDRKKCTSISDGFTSMPHLQDFPIVAELVKTGEIPEDAVFIPGHSGGLITGSHTPSSLVNQKSVSKNQLISKILNKNYAAWNLKEVEESYLEYFRNKIADITNPPETMSGPVLCDLSEFWEWQERQANYMVNSVRVYEYWGFEWRIPLWDKELVQFWKSVPAPLRADRKLFNSYLERYQKLPVSEANSPKIRKLNYFKNPLVNTRYGRFGGKTAYLKKLKAIAHPLPFNFIKPDRRVIRHNVGAISALIYLNEILDRTGAEIDYSE